MSKNQIRYFYYKDEEKDLHMKQENKNKGFTLVEMIVVIVIIGILLAILVPGLFKYIKKAKDQQALIECRAVVTAAQTLALEQYGNGTFLPETFNQYYSTIITQADVDGKIVSCTFSVKSIIIETLTYRTSSDIQVVYRSSGNPTFEITNDAEYSKNADGYLSFSNTASLNESVINEKTYDKKTKKLQELFLGKYPETSLSDYEKNILSKNKNINPDSYHWIPTYTSTGEVILLCTSASITTSRSNYSGSLIYYGGEYYYFYANPNQIIGTQYIGDKDFDMTKLTSAPDSISSESTNTWIKYNP